MGKPFTSAEQVKFEKIKKLVLGVVKMLDSLFSLNALNIQ